jgi:hypothetical protein
VSEDEGATRAQAEAQASDEADQEIRKLEEGDLPERLEDWPGGKAKYKTFGGPETESGYDEAATAKLGPSDLRRHEDGSIEIGGEKVDNPDDYKADPIPGGPTDPNRSDDLGLAEDDEQEEES